MRLVSVLCHQMGLNWILSFVLRSSISTRSATALPSTLQLFCNGLSHQCLNCETENKHTALPTLKPGREQMLNKCLWWKMVKCLKITSIISTSWDLGVRQALCTFPFWVHFHNHLATKHCDCPQSVGSSPGPSLFLHCAASATICKPTQHVKQVGGLDFSSRTTLNLLIFETRHETT